MLRSFSILATALYVPACDSYISCLYFIFTHFEEQNTFQSIVLDITSYYLYDVTMQTSRQVFQNIDEAKFALTSAEYHQIYHSSRMISYLKTCRKTVPACKRSHQIQEVLIRNYPLNRLLKLDASQVFYIDEPTISYVIEPRFIHLGTHNCPKCLVLLLPLSTQFIRLLLWLVWHQLQHLCLACTTCCVTKTMSIHFINGKCHIKHKLLSTTNYQLPILNYTFVNVLLPLTYSHMHAIRTIITSN